jgi:hypothetical protein
MTQQSPDGKPSSSARSSSSGARLFIVPQIDESERAAHRAHEQRRRAVVRRGASRDFTALIGRATRAKVSTFSLSVDERRRERDRLLAQVPGAWTLAEIARVIDLRDVPR